MPQIRRLGGEDFAIFFGMKDIDWAPDFLENKLLGDRLIEISSALEKLAANDEDN